MVGKFQGETLKSHIKPSVMYEVKRRKSKVKFYVKIFKSHSKTGKSLVNCNINTQTNVVTEKSNSRPKQELQVSQN